MPCEAPKAGTTLGELGMEEATLPALSLYCLLHRSDSLGKSSLRQRPQDALLTVFGYSLPSEGSKAVLNGFLFDG